MIANAFTCTGSYALLIMLGIKRVENRSDVKDWPGKIVGACNYSTRSRDDLVEF